jgi:hypothetical protein
MSDTIATLVRPQAAFPAPPPVSAGRGRQVLVVQGGPTTAVVRGHTGESVVLLSGELPADLSDESLRQVLDLAAAVLDQDEMRLFKRCLDALRRGDTSRSRRIEIDGAVLTVSSG